MAALPLLILLSSLEIPSIAFFILPKGKLDRVTISQAGWWTFYAKEGAREEG